MSSPQRAYAFFIIALMLVAGCSSATDSTLPTDATGQSSYDEAAANVAKTIGNIENLKATVDRAYMDWTYTQIRSPIAGLVGADQLTRGDLAIADSTILTTVGAIDPIYVYFDVDENWY